MKKLKKYSPIFIISTSVFFTAEAAHYLFWGKYFFYLINSIIMSVFIVYWGFIKDGCTKNLNCKKYRAYIGAVMLLWYFCKGCKDRFVMENTSASRFMWYTFYIALVLLPLLCFEFSLKFDGTSPVKLKNKVTLLRIVAALLIACVLTNDLHGLVFTFPNGFSDWSHDYSRNIFYYIILAFGILLFTFAVVRIFKQCTLPKSKKYVWLIIVPVVIGIVYIALYCLSLDLHINNIQIFGLTDVFCYLIILFIDGCDVIYRIATEIPDEEAFVLRRIYSEIEDSLHKTKTILDEASELDEEAYKSNLFKAGYIETYAKRVSNLILLGEQNDKTDFAELTLSLAESVEFLKLNKTDAVLFSKGEGEFFVSDLIAAYRAFQEKTEPVIDKLAVLMVVAEVINNKIEIRISAEDKEGNSL